MFSFLSDKKNLCFICAIMSACMYGTAGFYGTKIIQEGIAIDTMLFFRFFLSLVLCLFVAAYVRKQIVVNKSFFIQIAISAIFYTAATLFCFKASQKIGVGISMSIFFVFPLFNVLLSWLYKKESITRLVLLTQLLAIIGLYLISFSTTKVALNFEGVFCSLFAALNFALYLFFSKRLIDKTKNYMGSLVAVFFGNTLMFLLISILNGNFHLPTEITTYKNIFSMSVISTITPTVLLVYSLSKIGSAQVAILSVFEPICAVIIGVVCLAENLSNLQLVGVVVIIFSGFLIYKERSFKGVTDAN
ncbi:MAG: DMT family transporter [Rickettsiales bacterium]